MNFYSRFCSNVRLKRNAAGRENYVAVFSNNYLSNRHQKAALSAKPNEAGTTHVKIKLKRGAKKFDYDVAKTDRNYITPIRAMRIYHLDETHLEELPLCLRRSAISSDTVMKVYNIRDVEKKALQVHGSLETIGKLEANRVLQEDKLKQLKYIYAQVRKRLPQSPDVLSEGESTGADGVKGTQSGNRVDSSIAHKSLWVVKVAVMVNSINAFGKFVACAYTGSSAMFAEAVHSSADTLNQCILLYGKMHSVKRANSEYPYGYSNLQNVTALISGCGVFCIGSGLSFYHGISSLLHPAPISNLSISCTVLAFALFTESTSLSVAYQHLRQSAKSAGLSFISYIRRSNDPAVNVIFCEDVAAVVGIGLAGLSTTLTLVTGSTLWDAMGSLAVGSLLALVSGYIISTNASMLLGQSVPAEQMQQMRAILERDRIVRGLHDVKATDMGNGCIRFKAEADFDGRELTQAYLTNKVDLESLLQEVRQIEDVRGLEQLLLSHGEGVVDQLGEEVDRLEQKLREKHPNVRHVDLEAL